MDGPAAYLMRVRTPPPAGVLGQPINSFDGLVTMPSREEQFANSSAFAEVRSVLDEAEAIRLQAEETSMEAAESHRRLMHLIDAVRRRLEAADPLLAPLARLDNVSTNLSKARQEIENFRTQQSGTHVDQAMAHAEAALTQAMYIPIISTPADVQALQDASVSFRRSLGQHHRHAEEQLTASKSDLEGLRAQAAALASELQ